jgi:hypothetical protein
MMAVRFEKEKRQFLKFRISVGKQPRCAMVQKMEYDEIIQGADCGFERKTVSQERTYRRYS